MFKFSTRNRQLQLHNGFVSYDLIAESSQFNVRTSVDFSQTDRSLHLKFYSTPGRLSTTARTRYTDVGFILSLVFAQSRVLESP